MSNEIVNPQITDAVTQANKAPCKSCGKKNAVRDYGLMCEACQRVTKFSVSATELRRHIEEQQQRLDADFKRRVEENGEHHKRQQKLQEEHRAWTEAREIKMRACAEANAEARTDRMIAADKDMLRVDQLHRLYAARLSEHRHGMSQEEKESVFWAAYEDQAAFEEFLKKTKEGAQ